MSTTEGSRNPETSELARIVYRVAAQDAVWPVLPIIVVDMKTGEVLLVSQYASRLFGYEESELLGQPVEVLVPDGVKKQHVHWRQDTAVPKFRPFGQGRQVVGKRKDGSTALFHVGLTVTEADNKRLGIAFVVDLTSILQTAAQSAAPTLPDSSTQPPQPDTGPTVSKVVGVGLALLVLTATLILLLLWRSTVGEGVHGAEYMLAEARGYLRRGSYAEAERVFRATLAANGSKELGLSGLAESLFYQDRWEESLVACRELSAAAPNCGRGYYLKGLCLRKLGRTQEAQAEFLRAASHGDRYAIARIQRAGGF